MIVPIQQQQISTDVPGADLNSNKAGVSQAAQADAFHEGSLMSLGIYDKMVKAEAEEAYNYKMAELGVKSSKRMKDLEMSSVGGYMVDGDGNRTGKTVTQAYQEWANDEFHAGQASMPNQLGQDMFRTGGQQFFTRETIAMHTTEYAQRAAFFDDQRKISLDIRGNHLLAEPELEKSFEYLDNWQIEQQRSGKNGSLAANRVDMVTHTGQDDLSMKFFTGRINAIMEGRVPETISTGFGGEVIDPKTGKPVSGAAVQAPLGPLGAVRDLIEHLENRDGDPIDAALKPSYVDPTGRSAQREAQKMSSPRSALTPEHKDQLLNQLYALEHKLQTKEGNDFDQRIQSVKAGLHNGQEWSDKTFSDAFAMGMSVVKNKPEMKLHVVEGLMQLLATKHTRTYLPLYDGDPAQFKVMPTEIQKRLEASSMKGMASDAAMLGERFGLSENDRNFVGQVAIKEFKTAVESEMVKNAGDFEKDPASHIARNNPKVRNVFTTVDFEHPDRWTARQKTQVQTAMNTIQATKEGYRQYGQVSHNSFLPKDAAETLSKGFNDLKNNPATGVQRFNVLRESLGPNFEGSLDQMIDSKQVRPEMRLVALMGDKMRQQRVFDLMARDGGPRDVSLLFAGKFSKEDEQTLRTDLVEQTQVKLSHMYRNNPQGDNRQKIAQVQEAMLLHAKDMMYQNNMDPDVAAKSAAEFFLGDKKTDRINTGLFGGGSTIVYPNTLNDGSGFSETQKRQLNSFVQRTFTLEEFKKIPWDIPKDMGNVTPEKFAEHIWDNLKDENIRFGADPNKNPELQKYGPVQGLWITAPAVRNQNVLMNMPPRVKGANGESRIFFIPLNAALIDQSQFETNERAKSEKFKGQIDPARKGTTAPDTGKGGRNPQSLPIQKGTWGE